MVRIIGTPGQKGAGAFLAGLAQSARGQLARGREKKDKTDAAELARQQKLQDLTAELGVRQKFAAPTGGDNDALKARKDLAVNVMNNYRRASEYWNLIGQGRGLEQPNFSNMYRQAHLATFRTDPGEIAIEDIAEEAGETQNKKLSKEQVAYLKSEAGGSYTDQQIEAFQRGK